MDNYYAGKLNSQNLFQVYDTKIPRIKQYLQAEIDFVKGNLSSKQNVLELGAGYGRIVRELAPYCGTIVGIDISLESVQLGKEYLKKHSNASLIKMDVHSMEFTKPFDVILCLQNGLSAIDADSSLIHNILHMLSTDGTAYFSSYSSKFWQSRLQWFEEQASKGLLGKIDYTKTQNGIIVCNDGFKATTYSLEDFQKLGEESGCLYELEEVDESSNFLIIHKSLIQDRL